MIVVAIIALLASMALPIFRKVTLSTQRIELLNDVMEYSDAFNQYYFYNGTWPSGAGKNKIPAGMQGYLPNGYTQGGPFGGDLIWTGAAKLIIQNTEATEETMIELDEKIDDGDLNTGQFQKQGSKNYVLSFK